MTWVGFATACDDVGRGSAKASSQGRQPSLPLELQCPRLLRTSQKHKSSVKLPTNSQVSPHLQERKRAWEDVHRIDRRDDRRKKLPRDVECYFCNCFSHDPLETGSLCCEGEVDDLFLPEFSELFCDPGLSPLQDVSEVILGRTAVREHKDYEGSLVT